MMIYLSPDLLLTKNASTSKKYNDSRYEDLQLQTIVETRPPLIRKSFNTRFFDPFFFLCTSKFNEFFTS